MPTSCSSSTTRPLRGPRCPGLGPVLDMGAAAAMVQFKPDDGAATTSYVFFFIAGNAGLLVAHRIAGLLVRAPPSGAANL
jgi:hypothetical protein